MNRRKYTARRSDADRLVRRHDSILTHLCGRDMTSMEVELYEAGTRDVIAEETERLTLAYVPVIRYVCIHPMVAPSKRV